MELLELQKQYNLSREAASKLLKVSVRTLDRYLKAKRLSSRVVDGRIWLSRDEVEGFKYGKVLEDFDVSRLKVSIGNGGDDVDRIEVLQDDMSRPTSTKTRKSENETDEVYKNLFGELKQELTEKQERLEMANYRVGQLEAQLRQSIPMLQYHKENFENEKTKEELKEKLIESTDYIKNLQLKLKYLNFNKRIFLIILLIILALQPLWLIIRFE